MPMINLRNCYQVSQISLKMKSMVRILHASTLFILVSVMKTMGFGNQTSISKPMTLFSLSLKEIQRLRSLRSAMNEFVATCIPREIIKPLAVKEMYRMNRNRPRKTWTRRTKITTKLSYVKKKTYPMFSVRRNVIYWHLVKMFSGDDEEKKEKLLHQASNPKTGGYCYVQVFTYWRRHCFYSYYDYGGVKQIQSLLSNACLANWLNSTKIIRGLRSCCQSRFKYKKIRIF